MGGGGTRPISASSVLSRRKQRAVSQLLSTTSLSALCPLLWGAANLTRLNGPVTAKLSRKDPAARISPLPTTSRISRTGQDRQRVTALVRASKQSLLRSPICPTPSPLYMDVCMHTHMHTHIYVPT